jgi:2-iminobutanoate/2-iminopropanoate deaminase
VGNQARREFRVAGLAPPISHYTDAVMFGDLLFVSGCAPVDEDLNIVGAGDSVAQMRQVLDNMSRVLKAAGMTLADVLKVTVYMTNIDDRSAINTVRQEYFGDARPASTPVEVSRLAIPGMQVEMDAIAGMGTE